MLDFTKIVSLHHTAWKGLLLIAIFDLELSTELLSDEAMKLWSIFTEHSVSKRECNDGERSEQILIIWFIDTTVDYFIFPYADKSIWFSIIIFRRIAKNKTFNAKFPGTNVLHLRIEESCFPIYTSSMHESNVWHV